MRGLPPLFNIMKMNKTFFKCRDCNAMVVVYLKEIPCRRGAYCLECGEYNPDVWVENYDTTEESE